MLTGAMSGSMLQLGSVSIPMVQVWSKGHVDTPVLWEILWISVGCVAKRGHAEWPTLPPEAMVTFGPILLLRSGKHV